jgi:hypothetical protein
METTPMSEPASALRELTLNCRRYDKSQMRHGKSVTMEGRGFQAAAWRSQRPSHFQGQVSTRYTGPRLPGAGHSNLESINPEPFFPIHGSQLDLRPSTCLRCPGRRHRLGHAGSSIDHGLRPCTYRSWHFTGHACPQVGHPASTVKPYIILLNPASRLTPAGPSSWSAMSNVRYLTLLAPTMVFCSYY